MYNSTCIFNIDKYSDTGTGFRVKLADVTNMFQDFATQVLLNQQ